MELGRDEEDADVKFREDNVFGGLEHWRIWLFLLSGIDMSKSICARNFKSRAWRLHNLTLRFKVEMYICDSIRKSHLICCLLVAIFFSR